MITAMCGDVIESEAVSATADNNNNNCARLPPFASRHNLNCDTRRRRASKRRRTFLLPYAAGVSKKRTIEQALSNNNNNNKSAQASRNSVISLILVGLIFASFTWPTIVVAAAAAGQHEYQLVGQAGEQARLPCLIGRQLYCGEPYFIAWYKFNVHAKQWTRIELQQSQPNAAGSDESGPSSSSSLGGALSSRVRFTWSRSSQGQQSVHSRLACEQPTTSTIVTPTTSSSQHQARAVSINSNQQQVVTASRQLDAANFDCAHLAVDSLELADEGQYKCEITFSEALDFDKCPATTLSQLSVIGK